MLSGFSGVMGTVSQYPKISLSLFLAMLIATVWMFSKGSVSASFKALARVLWSVISTPFEFLRDALSIIRSARESEEDYRNTREFSLFRFSRILYFIIFITAILILSAGIAGSLISLYPKIEIDAQEALKNDVATANAQIAAVNRSVIEASQPTYRQGLQSALQKASSAAAAAEGRLTAVQASQSFTGPIVMQIVNADDVDALDRMLQSLDIYMSDCPVGPTWNNFTQQTCDLFRAHVVAVAKAKKEALQARSAVDAAQQALAQADSVVVDGNQRVAELKASIVSLEAQIKASPISTGSWIGPHIAAAIALVLGTVWWVVAVVWGGAISLDVMSWLILMMRSFELSAVGKLKHSDAEYEA